MIPMGSKKIYGYSETNSFQQKSADYVIIKAQYSKNPDLGEVIYL